VLHVHQQKTALKLAIPLHSTLAAVNAEMPTAHLTFLTTQSGKPFSPAGFGNWFPECCNEAGLPHGLREAAARPLAEAGCTMHDASFLAILVSFSRARGPLRVPKGNF
jgi:hypothetical protein